MIMLPAQFLWIALAGGIALGALIAFTSISVPALYALLALAALVGVVLYARWDERHYP